MTSTKGRYTMNGRDFMSGCNIFLTIFSLVLIMFVVFSIGYSKGAIDEYNYIQEEIQQQMQEQVEIDTKANYPHSRTVYRR